MKEETRGGKRPGAGRPPTVKGKRYTVTLDDTTVSLLKAINKNLSQAIRTLARQSHD